MAGLAIVIPRQGPGTGPTLPEPLYSLGSGSNDYTHRYLASRLTEAVGADVPSWPDQAGTQHLLATIAGVKGQDGTATYLDFAPGLMQRYSGLGALPEVFTIATLFRTPGGTGSDRYIFSNGYIFSALTGGFRLFATGQIDNPDDPNSAWRLMFLVCAGTSSAIHIAGGSTVGPGTITARNSSNLNEILLRKDSVDKRTQHDELIFWPRVVEATERASIYAAIKANKPHLS